MFFPPIEIRAAAVLACACVLASSAHAAQEHRMMHAHGQFDVKTRPQAADNPQAQASGVMRLALDKRFHGALDATGQGEMLAGGDGTTSGAYVAMEKVEGSLDGRTGSFLLVHRALMRDGAPQDWTVTVVPGSGGGALAGIEGAMRIRIVDGQHFYDLDYQLPGS